MQKRMRVFRPFKKGDRVIANSLATFHQNSHGIIEFVSPNGQHWVLRDGASAPVYYHSYELDFENPEDGYCMSDKILEEALINITKNRRDSSSDPDVFLEGFDEGARWAWSKACDIFEKQYQ